MRDRRARRHQATRDEILEAAWDLARREGLAALSLRDLARQVGMQAPSLYSYFGSKHAIYDAMFAQGAQQFRECFARWDRTGEPLHDLRSGLRAFIDFCTEDPARYQLLFQRTIPGFEPSPESFAVSVAGLEDTVQTLNAIGVTDPEQIDLLTAISTGLADQQISNDPGGNRWTRLIDQAAEMFLTHQRPRTDERSHP
jgi:AcrR family transcriptional regulator